MQLAAHEPTHVNIVIPVRVLVQLDGGHHSGTQVQSANGACVSLVRTNQVRAPALIDVQDVVGCVEGHISGVIEVRLILNCSINRRRRRQKGTIFRNMIRNEVTKKRRGRRRASTHCWPRW